MTDRMMAMKRHSGLVDYVVLVTIFTLAYIGTALVSLMIHGEHEGITPIWPPSGIALFAFHRYGLRMWPVVAIGIALLGWHVGIPPLAVGIAMLGNIGEAALGCLLIRRFNIELGLKFRDVIRFLFLPVLLAPVLGATIGTLGMVLGCAGSWSQLPIMWLMWWVGDSVGILLFTPLLFAWWRRPKLWSAAPRLLEWLVVTSATMLIGWHTFYAPGTADLHDHGNLQILVMPFLLWGAIRLGLRGATLVSLISCAWVLWGATNDTGPFHIDNKIAMGLYESSFIFVITLTGLIVQALSREYMEKVSSLRVGQQQLESRVRERTADLEQSEQRLSVAKQAAEAANASKTRFLAAASHDLRQPLQAIIAHTGILSAKNTDPALRESISLMDNAATAMRELLEKLLNVSEIDAGRLVPSLTTFPICNLLDELQGQFRQTATEKGLLLSSVPCSAQVYSDPGLVRVILQNLLSNAIKYTEQGKVLIGCRRRGELLRICVCDTGIGIARGGQQVIFEEFIQLENPARDRKLGIGFGLATVQRVAQLLNHSLHVQSVPGKGSCFALDVPFSTTVEPVNAGEADSSPAEDSGPAASLLLIDDDEIVLHATSLMLETQGYSVTAVSDAAGAFDALATQAHPDVIISDYRLPGRISGTELTNELRSRADRLIPAIILTGDIMIRGDENLPESCVLVQKPVSPAELKRVITHLLEGSG